MNEVLDQIKLFPLEFIWLTFSLTFLATELITPGLFYCLSFAVGSFAAACFAFFVYSIELQCGIALAVSCGSFFLLQKFVKEQHLSNKHFEKNSTNTDALMGQHALVIETVAPEQRGTIKINGELWSAGTHETKIFNPGTTALITHIQGNTLFIRSISSFLKD